MLKGHVDELSRTRTAQKACRACRKSCFRAFISSGGVKVKTTFSPVAHETPAQEHRPSSWASKERLRSTLDWLWAPGVAERARREKCFLFQALLGKLAGPSLHKRHPHRANRAADFLSVAMMDYVNALYVLIDANCSEHPDAPEMALQVRLLTLEFGGCCPGLCVRLSLHVLHFRFWR